MPSPGRPRPAPLSTTRRSDICLEQQNTPNATAVSLPPNAPPHRLTATIKSRRTRSVKSSASPALNALKTIRERRPDARRS
jgi:hypothetical protein